MKKYLISLSIVIFLPFPLIAQKPLTGADSATRIIDTLINYAKARSLYRNRVDWRMLTDSVRKQCSQAKSINEIMPSVELFYKLLGDFHGFVNYNKKFYKWRIKENSLDTVAYKSLIKKVKQYLRPEVKLLEKEYGYLLIPSNNPTQYREDQLLAQEIQDSLAKLHPEKLKGIVIDLRTNPGGDMYPMILGVGNLLGKGQFGSFIDPVTKKKEEWGIKKNYIYYEKNTMCKLKNLAPSNSKLKVVVLIGPYTASSGEATAISFKGRKNTWFIGEDSAGYTTGNASFKFYDLNIFMAIAVEADRNNNVYLDKVSPDQKIFAGDNFEDLTKDSKVIAALRWLHDRK